MTTERTYRKLPPGEAARVDALCEEFERAWSAGAAPKIDNYVLQAGESLRAAALRELLKIELQVRRERRDAVTSEEYLARFPDCASVINEVWVADTDGSAHSTGKIGSGLQVRCPHCHNPIELSPEAELESIRCTSCGSDFSLTSDDDQKTRDARGFAQIGHFKLVERLGMGAFGTVWKAQDIELDRTVAIKIPRTGQLDKQRQDFFFREARSAAQLRHPNIVPVYEVGREGDTLYIVSEFVRGITLADRLSAGPMAAREAARLCAKIAEALHHAHEQGIIHRDLKPANVMLDAEDEPHLMDFGLARREANEITMTIDGQVLGTPAYMSPEQAQGEAHVADRRSDVYSLGVMLFETLTGELPFRGNARMMIHQVIHDEPPNPRELNSSIPRDMETIALKCMQKEPHRRYQEAAEVARELARYLRGEPIEARPVSALERRLRWCKRNPLVASLAATAILLLAGVAVVATIGYTQTSQALAEKNEAAAASDAVSKFLQGLFLTSNPLVANDEYGAAVVFRKREEVNLSARELLDRGAERIDEELSNQPRVKVRLLTSMGDAYNGLGMYDKAAKLYRDALAIEEKYSSPDSLTVADAMHRLAVPLGHAGQHGEAESLFRKALKKLMEGAGDAGIMPSTAVKQSLAMLFMSQDKFDEAEVLLNEIIDTRERIHGPMHDSVAHGLQALAALQLMTGKLEEADETIIQFLQAAENNRTGDWKSAADIIGRYRRGLRERDADHHERAAILLEKTVSDISRLLGGRHPFVALVMYDQGMALGRIGKHQEAVDVLERAVDIGAATFAPEHRVQLFGRRNLAIAYVGAGMFDKAERLFNETKSGTAAVWGSDSWQYADLLADQAIVKFKKRQPEAGNELTDRALKIVAGLPSPDKHERGIGTLFKWHELAGELVEVGNFAVADRAINYGQLTTKCDPLFAPWKDRFNVLRARILIKQGNPRQAAELLRTAHQSLVLQLGATHDAAVEAENSLREAENLAPSAGVK